MHVKVEKGVISILTYYFILKITHSCVILTMYNKVNLNIVTKHLTLDKNCFLVRDLLQEVCQGSLTFALLCAISNDHIWHFSHHLTYVHASFISSLMECPLYVLHFPGTRVCNTSLNALRFILNALHGNICLFSH